MKISFLFFVFALGELDPTPWRPHPDGRSIHVRVRPAVQHCQDASVRGLDAADQIHASQRRRTVRMSDIHPAAPQPIHSIECRRLVSVFCQSSLVAVCLPSGRFPRSFDSRRYTRRLKDADDALFSSSSIVPHRSAVADSIVSRQLCRQQSPIFFQYCHVQYISVEWTEATAGRSGFPAYFD